MRHFQFWRFKSSHELLEKSLGSLEREVMALVWCLGEINVRDGKSARSVGATRALTASTSAPCP